MTPASECPAAADARVPGAHIFLLTFRRPWWRGGRRTYVLGCWECDLAIPEPLITIDDRDRQPRKAP